MFDNLPYELNKYIFYIKTKNHFLERLHLLKYKLEQRKFTFNYTDCIVFLKITNTNKIYYITPYVVLLFTNNCLLVGKGHYYHLTCNKWILF